MRRCYGYWLRNADCTDIRKHGYVGVSVNPKNRARVHRHRRRFPDFELELIFCGSQSECYAMEINLRPVAGIGWNVEAGGPRKGVKRPTISAMNKRRWECTDHREKMKAICTGNRWGAQRTDEGKARSLAAMKAAKDGIHASAT